MFAIPGLHAWLKTTTILAIVIIRGSINHGIPGNIESNILRA